VASTLDRNYQHTLVSRARPCDSLRDDAALLGNESLKLLVGLVIDILFFVVAESASAFLSYLTRSTSL
jgi:hypothetical protein